MDILTRLLGESRHTIFFTGAGISTESGIPDFRSPGGVWSKMQPIYFQDFMASEHVRREAWRRRFSNADGWVGAKPNRGHHAVAELIRSGRASVVVTQNVDNLHQDSGVPEQKVIELHGNSTYAKCVKCQTRVELAEIEREFQQSEHRRALQALRRHHQDRDNFVRPADARATDAPCPGRNAGVRFVS